MDVLQARAAAVEVRLPSSNVQDIQPVLSVVVPVLNEAVGLAQFLRSTLAVLPADTEMILVDGGSTDGSSQIAKEFALKVLHSQRVGHCR